MSSNSTWVPNEDHHTLISERCWLHGAVLGSVIYGIAIPLFFISFRLLVQRQMYHGELRNRLFLLIYLTLSFLLGTSYMILLAALTQMAFIDNRNYPGGPSAYEQNMFSIPVNETANVMYTLSNWLCDALVIWRFKVIFQSSRFPMWLVMSFPCLLFAGSIAMGTMCLIQDMSSGPYIPNGVIFVLPYGIITLVLNITLTVAIVFRLMRFKHEVVSVTGTDYGTQYTSIVAMIVESAALFSAAAVAFLVLFGIGNPVSQVFIQSLSQIQIIATLLIVFRVAQGKAWTRGTAAYVMSQTAQGSERVELARMQFATSPGVSLALASSGEGTKSHVRLDTSTDKPSKEMV